MKINGIELKDLVEEQKSKYKKHLNIYNNNIRKIAEKANRERSKAKLGYNEIGWYAGVSPDAVSEFLRGKSLPNPVSISVICASIEKLKELKAND